MSDLASPLLYATRDEATAYILFCALMSRVKENFNSSGASMSRKFSHLVSLLQYYDPEFYCYLKLNNAHELLFCYRWILLELKREFALDDALQALEVLWSSIPPVYVQDLPMFEEGHAFKPGQGSNHSSMDSTSRTVTNSMDALSLTASTLKASSVGRDKVVFGRGGSSIESTLRSPASVRRSRVDRSDRNGGLVKKSDSTTDEDLNSSSGRGSLSTYSSVGTSGGHSVTHAIDVPQRATRPIRKIRFLPKILSNDDSREIDSPDEEEFEKQRKFCCYPPKLIDKQFSVDIDHGDPTKNGSCRASPSCTSLRNSDHRRIGSFEGELARLGSSFDRNDPRGRRGHSVESVDGLEGGCSRTGSVGSLSPKRRVRIQSRLADKTQGRARLLRQRQTTEEDAASGISNSPGHGDKYRRFAFANSVELSVEQDADEFLSHCNGEYADALCSKPRNGQQEWSIPRGLARSLSWDSVAGSVDIYDSSCSNSRQNSRDCDDEEDDAIFWGASPGNNQRNRNCHEHHSKNSPLRSSLGSSCGSLVVLSSSGQVQEHACSARLAVSLPSPSELGSSSAFMLFLCLTMLLQHRDTVMSRRLDCNEIAMYFDGLVRKHKVKAVLETGRRLFHSYLSEWQRNQEENAANQDQRDHDVQRGHRAGNNRNEEQRDGHGRHFYAHASTLLAQSDDHISDGQRYGL